MEDQYPLNYLSFILKSYLARKRRLADGDTKRKLAETTTDTLTLTDEKLLVWFVYDTLSLKTGPLDLGIGIF